jgi:DNA-binding MarR family transcriptional regulator
LASKKRHDDLSTSICRAALTSFSKSDDSLAGLIEQYSIKVRDFMLLSLLCDQESLDADQLERALGLTSESIARCIDRLSDAGLVKHDGSGPGSALLTEVRTTVAGRLLTQRVLDNVG